MKIIHNSIFTLILTTIVVSFSPSKSLAKRGGESSGGGGDVIICEKAGTKEVRLADTFEIFRSGKRIIYPAFQVETFEQALGTYLEGRYPDLRKRLLYSLARLTFRPASKVPEFNDDFIGPLPQGCQKKQLAIQNLQTGIVQYDMSLYFSMKPVERALFHLHEALVNLRGTTGDTTPLRHRLHNGYESSLESSLVVEAAIHAQNRLILSETNLGNGFVFAAMEVCYQLPLKSCSSYFIDFPFENSCGESGSKCDLRFKTLFDKKIVELGLSKTGVPEKVWNSEIHAGRQVFSSFFLLPMALRQNKNP